MIQMVVIVAKFCYSGVKFCISDTKICISEIVQFTYCTIMQKVVNVMQNFVALMAVEETLPSSPRPVPSGNMHWNKSLLIDAATIYEAPSSGV